MNRRQAMLLTASAAACLAPKMNGVMAAGPTDAWQFSFTSLEGTEMPFETWRGKVLLVVNTASFCGFTSQYEGLVSVWQDYRDDGLVVVGVPSGDFRQEYEDTAKIKDFCELTFGVDFPMTAPLHVKGPDADPFYKWAAAETGKRVTWNFNKYLVGRDGRIKTWMPSRLEPDSVEARAVIEEALAAPA
ncbi:glutathione peroxidase [Amaricoccus tamworthensis]|uniref:glutathione peroxidase n=1 Tax=Amaricoccus tamworthensis TaxID=57002 RepID=UPI003C79848F